MATPNDSHKPTSTQPTNNSQSQCEPRTSSNGYGTPSESESHQSKSDSGLTVARSNPQPEKANNTKPTDPKTYLKPYDNMVKCFTWRFSRLQLQAPGHLDRGFSRCVDSSCGCDTRPASFAILSPGRAHDPHSMTAPATHWPRS